MPRKAKNASLSDVDAAPGGVAAVDRALSLMTAFSVDEGAMTLGDLAARTGLYKSTVLRMLASLVHAGWVQRLEDGRYAPGEQIARLHNVYATAFSLDRIVIPVLEALVHATGESAAYHVRQGDDRLCLYRVDSPHPVRDHTRAGDRLPLQKGSGGRVLCAFDKKLGFGASDDSALYADIRKAGYFAATGDRLQDVAGISAPVFLRSGDIAAAVTLTVPAHRYAPGFLALVRDAARKLTGRVG